jgi:hypothetical protein
VKRTKGHLDVTEPTKEQKFLEQEYIALRTEKEQASERAFKIFAASVLVVPTGLALGGAAGPGVLPLIKMLLPLLLLAFYAMYQAHLFSIRRTGLYIESHIEPNLLVRTRGWESWLSDRRFAYDAQMNAAFFLLSAVYYLGTVYVAVRAVKKDSPLEQVTKFLDFTGSHKAIWPHQLEPSSVLMLFIFYALAGLTMVFLVQLVPSRQLKEEERIEEVFRSEPPVPGEPKQIQNRFLANLEELLDEQKFFKGKVANFLNPFKGHRRIKSYHCHTETFRQELKSRHVRVTIRGTLNTQAVITTVVGLATMLGLLLWAVMPIQRFLHKFLGFIPPSIVAVLTVVLLALLLMLILVPYDYLIGKNIGAKIDIRFRPAESKRTMYIVQTSERAALKDETDEPHEWLRKMLKRRKSSEP